MMNREDKVWTLDVQGLHEWAIENDYDVDHYSLNKLIELYIKKDDDDGCIGEWTHPNQYIDDNDSYHEENE